MVHEEFIDRPYSPFGAAEKRPSGPTILEPAVPEVPTTEESNPAPATEGKIETTAGAEPAHDGHVPPWQAAARAKGRPAYFIAKRCLDCVVSLIAIAVLSPLLLVIALAVKLTSRGPVIYRQERVGYAGRPFTMYKFRSMYVKSDESLHRRAYEQFLRGERTHGKVDGEMLAEAQPAQQTPPQQKRFAFLKARTNPSGDPRVTRVGHFLRRTSLDELPQFFNALLGNMSLVGPRPPILYEVGLYQPWHMERLDTLPGITGVWQVHGRSRVTFDQMVKMDVEYIHQQSFWYDVKLIVQTIPAVLNRKGAY